MHASGSKCFAAFALKLRRRQREKEKEEKAGEKRESGAYAESGLAGVEVAHALEEEVHELRDPLLELQLLQVLRTRNARQSCS